MKAAEDQRGTVDALSHWLLLVLLALPSSVFAGPAGDEAAAINMAGRQRMLTQRVVKLHAQIGMGVAAGHARVQLGESLALLSRQTGEIEPFARTPELREAVARLRRAGTAMEALALAVPTKEGAPRLDAVAEDMLAMADQLTSRLEPGRPLGWLVNVSGRQRMLSQRLAKFYLLRAWGVSIPGLAAQVEAAQEEFSVGLGRLLRAGENTAEIDRELYAIAVQWEWFMSALALEGVASYALVVADASESMLNSLERVVTLYQQAATR